MDLALIDRNASRAAGRYKRKCWWVDYDELHQVAALAQVEASPKFDPSWGRPLEAYLWRAAFIAVRTAVAKASAPVSSRSQPQRDLRGLYRAPLPEDTGAPLHAALVEEPHVVRYDRARRVRERVTSLFGEQSLEFALGVLTHEWNPRDVAREHGVAVTEVYAARQLMTQRLAADEVLLQLWKEMD